MAELRRLEPHIVLLGGDFVCVHARDVRRLAAGLATLAPPLGVFAVLGNHDYSTDAPYVGRALERAGVTLLVNRNCRLPSPWQDVWICGLDDAAAGRPDPAATFAGATGVRLLLTHAPAGLGAIGTERFDLALCGHTHGGQLALPGGMPLYLPAGHWSRRYAAGRFDLPGGRTLIVSRGVGYSTVPFRTFCDPELQAMEIVAAAAPAAVGASAPHRIHPGESMTSIGRSQPARPGA
jgi:predicted MPP superfamily phosphohydrolase